MKHYTLTAEQMQQVRKALARTQLKHGRQIDEQVSALNDAALALLDAAMQAPEATAGGDVRPEVMAFARMMEAQLKRNESRGHWRDCGSEYLMNRIHEQADDLGTYAGWKDLSAFARTCADIANFSMMLADNAGTLAAAPKPCEPDHGATLTDATDAKCPACKTVQVQLGGKGCHEHTDATTKEKETGR